MRPTAALATSACLSLLAVHAAAQGSCFVESFVGPTPSSQQSIGHALDAHGHTAIAGSTATQEVFLYTFDVESASWVHQASLAGDALQPGDEFGHSVAISGDFAAVGAPGRDEGGTDSGSVFVFERSGGSWLQVAELNPGDGKPFDRFGEALALDGQRLVVGAPFHDGPIGADAGVVYLYERDGQGWSLTRRIAPDSPRAGATFGATLGLSANLLVVGEPQSVGRAFAFELLEGAALEQWLLLEFTFAGRSLAIDGQRVAVGFIDYTFHGIISGGFEVHERSPGGWTLLYRLDPMTDDYWGGPVMASKMALQGSRLAFTTGLSTPGGFRVWKDASFEASYFVGSSSHLGRSLAFAQGQVLAGAPLHVDPESGLVGAVFAWRPGKIDTCPTRYCYGTACPCGNDGSDGCLNSTGSSGVLDVLDGMPTLDEDSLRLVAIGLPLNQPALLFRGPNKISVPFADGLRCVGAGQLGTFRYPPLTAVDGTAIFGPGLIADSCTGPSEGCILPGSTWNFQVWYRDPAGPCGTGSNLTNGLGAIFSVQ